MRVPRHARAGLAGLAAAAVLTGLIQAVAVADSPAPTPTAPTPSEPGTTNPPPAVSGDQRADVLGENWKTSTDRVWTTSSDAQGFHILTADKKTGYTWKTATTLSEPGLDADAWIGNACVTGSGKRAIAVYAPRTFTNKPELMTRGAFTAVVDLTNGKVTKLAVQSSLAYFSPGCGRGEKAVVSQFTDDSATHTATRLVTVDALAGTAGRPLKLDGQVTSAIPYQDGIAAADGYRVVKVDHDGKRAPLATASGVPFQLRSDRDGGLVFLDRTGNDSSSVKRALAGKTTTLARGRLADMDLTASADGTVFITGKAKNANALPGAVKNSGAAKDATASTNGEALVRTQWQHAKQLPKGTDILAARPVTTQIDTPATGRTARLTTTPGALPVSASRLRQGAVTSPALKAPASAPKAKLLAADPNNPVEDERTCAVPRGSVTKQALQPTPRQVEWAVNQTVINSLDKWISRPANWNGTGMIAYSPQSRLFPLHVLAGDPNGVIDRADEWHIPSQILLGVTAQESNMWQAARTVVPGLTGNSLIGNYYGIKYAADGSQGDPWAINWASSDCGYGITQVTDGMRKASTALSNEQKEGAALDYTANIAYGADILTSKWNETRKDGLTVNGGKPKYIENWFFALWAYNSGYHPKSAASSNGGKWGVGWTNNPANPLWKENRLPFLESASGGDDYSHAAHPQDWPYQEKVIGWAARPISAMFKPGDMQPGYRAAWWNNNQARTQAKPPIMIFCTTSNDCDNSKISDGASNQTGKGPCKLPGDPSETDPLYLKCWWHEAVKWKDCDAAAACGNPVHRFNDTDYPEQPNQDASYPARCASNSGLPSGALVVDDVPNATRPAGTSGHTCGAVSSAGTFKFDFTAWTGSYPGKIDLHQIGAGYGNHFWFTHTRPGGTTDGDRLKTTGTWTLGRTLDQWVRIMVHTPDHGAHTQQARYDIDTGTGAFTRHRYIGQEYGANTWVTLGVYKVSGTPRVQLASQANDGTGDDDVAWDAVAFQPIGSKPKQSVAILGDSYTSGEGAGAYSAESNKDYDPNGDPQWNACRRSQNSWARKTTLPGYTSTIGQLTDTYDGTLDVQNVSCSGAFTNRVTPGDPTPWGRDGNFREKSQIDSGILSTDTTLVGLTIGGNDAGFPVVMQMCATTGCPAEADVKRDIDNTIPEIENVLRDINTAAPNAKIVLLGYPRLFNASVTTCVSGVGGAGMNRLNYMGDYMSAQQKQLVETLKAQRLPVSFESPDSDFEGKRACDSNEGINKLVAAQQGDGDFTCTLGQTWCISRESYHPNGVGTSAYAQAFRRAVNNL